MSLIYPDSVFCDPLIGNDSLDKNMSSEFKAYAW
jgi:hypothetical protein